MSYKFTATAGTVPAGEYRAKFSEIKDWENRGDNDYGDAVLLSFEIIEGEHEGTVASRIVPLPENGHMRLDKPLGQFANALMGGDLKPGAPVDFEALIGTSGKIAVEATKGGSTRVESFTQDDVPF